MIQDFVFNTTYYQRGPLPPFDGVEPFKISRFSEDFEEAADFYNWDEKEKSKKIPTFLSEGAKTGYRLYVKELISKETLNWTAFKDAIIDYFLPSPYESYLREQLRNRIQRLGETVTSYILAKSELCYRLNRTMSESEKVDYLFDGLQLSLKGALYVFAPATVRTLLQYAQNLERGAQVYQASEDSKEIKRVISELKELLEDSDVRHEQPFDVVREESGSSFRCCSCRKFLHFAED